MPYGLEELPYARHEGYLVVPEGESDSWTLRFHDFPCLAIPGASAVGCLAAEHVRDIPKLYLIQEPDRGGEHFIAGMAQQLRTIGWHGETYVISMNGAKDPNGLHQQDPDRFKEAFQAALGQAQPLPLDEHATTDDDQVQTLPPDRQAVAATFLKSQLRNTIHSLALELQQLWEIYVRMCGTPESPASSSAALRALPSLTGDDEDDEGHATEDTADDHA